MVYDYCVFYRYYYPPHKSNDNCFSTIETVVPPFSSDYLPEGTDSPQTLLGLLPTR